MEKMLVVVVDGTINMAPYWDTIRTSVLNNIIRNFCTSVASTHQDPFDEKYFLNLVVYGTPDPFSGQPSVLSSCAQDMDSFMSQLSRLTFTDNGLTDPPLEDGLSTALMMFPSTQGRTQTQLSGTRHCVLVTASKPSSCFKFVWVPRTTLEFDKIFELDKDLILADAEIVASLFAQLSVTLSVIGPKEIPTLETIYNAANDFREVLGASMEFVHPELLIFISVKFPEAKEALKYLVERNQQIQQDHESLFFFANKFSVGQLDMMFHQLVSEPSVEQPKLKSANEDSIEQLIDTNTYNVNDDNCLCSNIYQPYLDNNLATQRRLADDGQNERTTISSAIAVVEEKMDSWPFEVVCSNFPSSSTNMTTNKQTVTFNSDPNSIVHPTVNIEHHNGVETGDPSGLNLGQRRVSSVPLGVQRGIHGAEDGSCTKP